jgi:putative hemolysin
VEEVGRIAALLALVATNAFFVIGEYAVVTARRAPLRRRAEEGSRGAAAAIALMDDPVRVISTVQVGITAVGILSGAVGQPLVQDMLGGAVPGWLAFLLAFAVVTYLTVVFGELVPKTLTLKLGEALAVRVARPIAAIAVVLHPVVWLLQSSAGLLLKPFGIEEVVAGERITSPQELREAIDEAEGEGVIPHAQEELLHNVFDFATREAADVMRPTHEVDWLDAELTAGAALERVIERPHERYPVGSGSLDALVGVIHEHEVVRTAHRDPHAPIGPLADPALVVPETKDLGALLRELRETRRHMAVVADEYGQTLGIVTLEDILEEIVGEIADEYDLPDNRVSWLGERTIEIAGTMTIDDFNEMTGTDLPRDANRTMAGLAFSALGHRPEPGDETRIDGLVLRVEETDGARIGRLRIEFDTPPKRRHEPEHRPRGD